jgi:hypothetical protein
MGIAGFRPESRQTAARERIRDAKQHRASQLLSNPTEQAALARGKALHALRLTLEHDRRTQCLAMVDRDPGPTLPS